MAKTIAVTHAESQLLMLMTGRVSDLGSFKSHLWQAIVRADLCNLALLKRGFPEEVTAYERWIGEAGYAEDLKRRANLAD